MAAHTTWRNGKLFCTNCGDEQAVPQMVAISDLVERIDAFNRRHKKCPKTYVEPKVDESKTEQEKALWWMANGEVGSSSKTMWHCFMGTKEFPIDIPYDPDDFSRCYKLLNTVPEWKAKLSKLKSLSPEWSNLVDNWDKLTEMYEMNVKTKWEKPEEIGMYQFMRKLRKP